MKFTLVITHRDPDVHGTFNPEYILRRSWALNIPHQSVMYMCLLSSGKARDPDKAELVSEPMLSYQIDGLLDNQAPFLREIVTILKTGEGEDKLLKAIREFNKFTLPSSVPPYMNGNPF